MLSLDTSSRRWPLAALAAGALLASTGCATATRVALGDAQRSQVGSVKTVAALSQQELGVSIVQSNAGASFGLVGAIIDSSVNNSRGKDAETAAAPVRDALVSYDAAATLGAALSRELRPVGWLKGNTVETRSLPDTKAALTDLVKKSGADRLLVVQTDYRLTPGFAGIVITAKVSLLPRPASAPADAEDGTAPPDPEPVYFNTLVAAMPLPGWTEEMPVDEAARRWAADGGKRARRALDDGFADLARMVAFDLQQGAPTGASYDAPGDARELTVPAKYAVGVAKGWVVHSDGARSWVRLRSGELSSVGQL